MADRVSVAARNLGWARYAGEVAGEEENALKACTWEGCILQVGVPAEEAASEAISAADAALESISIDLDGC